MVTRGPGRRLPADPPVSGRPYWVWFGDRPALDLVNTIRQRWRGGVELLVTPDDLAAWFVDAGVLRDAAPVSRRLLRDARDLRSAIDAGVQLAVAGRRLSPEIVEALNGCLHHAGTHPPQLAFEGSAVVLLEGPPSPDARWALGRVALDAARMLSDGDASRIRICEGDRCGIRFFDRSRRGRRWCAMGACGNRAKVRAHRERTASKR